MQTKYCCFPYYRIYLHKGAYFKINVTIYGFKTIIRNTIGGASDGRVATLFQVRAFTMSILMTVGNHEIRSWVCFRIAHFPCQVWRTRLIIFEVERADAQRPILNVTVLKAFFALQNNYPKFRCLVTIIDPKLVLHKAVH